MSYLTANDFAVGSRVQISPACDMWMRGARYGTVVKTSRVTRNAPKGIVHVDMDSGHRMRLDPQLIAEIV